MTKSQTPMKPQKPIAGSVFGYWELVVGHSSSHSTTSYTPRLRHGIAELSEAACVDSLSLRERVRVRASEINDGKESSKMAFCPVRRAANDNDFETGKPHTPSPWPSPSGRGNSIVGVKRKSGRFDGKIDFSVQGIYFRPNQNG